MDISAISSEITTGAKIDVANVQPATIGKEFNALLFEMLLKSSGFAEAFTTGGEGGEATAVFGDMAIQVLASELARDMNSGISRAITIENK